MTRCSCVLHLQHSRGGRANERHADCMPSIGKRRKTVDQRSALGIVLRRFDLTQGMLCNKYAVLCESRVFSICHSVGARQSYANKLCIKMPLPMAGGVCWLCAILAPVRLKFPLWAVVAREFVKHVAWITASYYNRSRIKFTSIFAGYTQVKMRHLDSQCTWPNISPHCMTFDAKKIWSVNCECNHGRLNVRIKPTMKYWFCIGHLMRMRSDLLDYDKIIALSQKFNWTVVNCIENKTIIAWKYGLICDANGEENNTYSLWSISVRMIATWQCNKFHS